MIIYQHQHKDRRFIFPLPSWWHQYIEYFAKETQLRLCTRKAFLEMKDILPGAVEMMANTFPPDFMVIFVYRLLKRWKERRENNAQR